MAISSVDGDVVQLHGLDLTVVIPAFRERENLIELLPRVTASLDGGASARVAVVVERDCPDDDARAVADLGAQVIRRGPSDSFGDAIRTGIASVPATCKWVLVMDADGSHDPATIPRMREAARTNGSDVVIASRYVKGGGSANRLPLYLMSRLLNRTYSLVLGIDARDLSTNYKLYRADLIRPIILTCTNFDVVEEILVRIRHNHPDLKVTEIPDYFHRRKHGTSKRHLGPFVVSYLVTLARLRWSTRSGSTRT